MPQHRLPLQRCWRLRGYAVCAERSWEGSGLGAPVLRYERSFPTSLAFVRPSKHAREQRARRQSSSSCAPAAAALIRTTRRSRTRPTACSHGVFVWRRADSVTVDGSDSATMSGGGRSYGDNPSSTSRWRRPASCPSRRRSATSSSTSDGSRHAVGVSSPPRRHRPQGRRRS